MKIRVSYERQENPYQSNGLNSKSAVTAHESDLSTSSAKKKQQINNESNEPNPYPILN